MYQSIRQSDRTSSVIGTAGSEDSPPPYSATEETPGFESTHSNDVADQRKRSAFDKHQTSLMRTKYSGPSKDSALVANDVMKNILKHSVEQAFEELIDSGTVQELMGRAISKETTFESTSVGNYGPDAVDIKPQRFTKTARSEVEPEEQDAPRTRRPSRSQVCHRVSSYGLAFGSFWSRTSTVQLDTQSDRSNGSFQTTTSFMFYPASWLGKFGMQGGVEVKVVDGWKFKFEPVRAVPESSAIFDLCRSGEVRAVQLLIEKGHASVFDMSPKGWTPLHFAAAEGHVELCASLIELGANRAALAYEGPSLNALSPVALFATLARNLSAAKKIEMLRLFVEHLDISEPNGDGWTVHAELKRTYNSENVPVSQNSITWLLRTTADEPFVSFGPYTIWTAVQHAVRAFVVHEQHDQILSRLLCSSGHALASVGSSHAAAFAHWFALRSSERELLPMVLDGGRFCQIRGFDWVDDDIQPSQFLKALPVIYAAWAVALPNGIDKVEELISLELDICMEQLGWTRDTFVELISKASRGLDPSGKRKDLDERSCSACGDLYGQDGYGLVQPARIRFTECFKTNHRWACDCNTYLHETEHADVVEKRYDSQDADDAESDVDEVFFDSKSDLDVGDYDIVEACDTRPDPFLDAALMLYRAQGRNWIGSYSTKEQLCATCFLRREEYIGENGIGTERNWPPMPLQFETFRAPVKDCTVEVDSN
ncbi:hypothetical protein BDV96DRAFT_590856 [Lophiotrema nucula]|uniref:Uncharacterized protein n=1 Tax=Lophiotrema nucula TaxID=690887 RepID=A0A6A5YHY4_9PLEO|nr:hypothetical protein BDV96DRAFT_590856 [Lophiotrema nucula]